MKSQGPPKVVLTGKDRAAVIRARRVRDRVVREVQEVAQKAQNDFMAEVDKILDEYIIEGEVQDVELTTGEVIFKKPPAPAPAPVGET
ncbi:MAG: hypothetical protein ACLP74_01460 [Thermoplasmata archaeon]